MTVRTCISVITAFSLLGAAPLALAQHPTDEEAWRFNNFRTMSALPWSTDFTWKLYRDTFIGIPPERDPWSSAFDVLFFDLLYETELGSAGNCYGMTLLSALITHKGAHLGFCAPVSQYSGDSVGTMTTLDLDGDGNPDRHFRGPTNDRLREVINRLHGHQVNLATLLFFRDIILVGKNRDGQYAYDQVLYYKMRDDPVLVSITETLNPADGGHTMVAYDAGMVGGQQRIFVYDPNRPGAIPTDPYYTGDQNVITIGTGGSWEFLMAGETVPWSGSPSSGGNITITPISVTGPTGRTPSSMGLDILHVVTMIFISGDGAALDQITNEQSKRAFKPGTLEPDIDPTTGMRNVVPWFPSDGSGRVGGAPYFIVGDPGGALELQVRSGTGGYRVDLAGGGGRISVSARRGSGKDVITIDNAGRRSQSLQILNSCGASDYDIEFTQVIQPGERARTFTLANVKVAKNARVELKIIDQQSALSIVSLDAPVSFDAQLRRRTILGDQVIELPGAQIEAGQDLVLRPKSWLDLGAGFPRAGSRAFRNYKGK